MIKRLGHSRVSSCIIDVALDVTDITDVADVADVFAASSTKKMF